MDSAIFTKCFLMIFALAVKKQQLKLDKKENISPPPPCVLYNFSESFGNPRLDKREDFEEISTKTIIKKVVKTVSLQL